MHMDPDNFERMRGVDPTKQREREQHKAELRRKQAEVDNLVASTKLAESETRWGKISAIAAIISAIAAIVAAVLVAIN